MERGEGVAVERLTARLAGPAAPGVDERQARRVWLSTLLAGCDLVPPAMPPSATLVVRQLADPLPGQIARSRHAVRPEPEWEQAVRGALSDLWRRAARPGSGHGVAAGGRGPASAVPVPVPEDAEAVFFLDAAELTACLALDLAEGRAHGRWWWRKLLPPGGATRDEVFLVLSRRPELLPAAFAYLAAWGKAQVVVGALSAPEGLLLALAVSAAYGLPDWRDVAVPADLPLAGRPPLGDAPAAALPPASPWAPPVAAHLAGLGREQAVCLGLGLTLAGAAHHAATPPVKSAEFATALAAWWEAKDMPIRPLAPEARAAVHTDQTSPLPTASGSVPPATRTSPEFASVTPLSGGEAPQVNAASRAAEHPVEVRPEWPLPVALPPEGVVTRIGGVLYLINVMCQLGFPEGFPADIGPWALLEALARAMLPGHDPFAELAADPLWAVLAELDGRPPRTLPGDDLSGEIPFELGAGSETAELGDTLAADLNPALLAWLALAVPYLDRYLQETLQMEEPIPHLLLVPGRLHVTATHVELTTDLERISVPVRMAGLDRDPGWQAPFRRVILFHFV